MAVRKKPNPSVLDTFLALREPLERSAEESRSPKPNLMDSLALASVPTLQDFQLSRLASAANLQKDLIVILQQMVDQLAEAKLAELLLHHAERNPRKNRE
jgi:hypothetical protein